ncbi:hypothetical protein PFISCL1PPCAC_20527, partial [Pristionchus fissidentatus]
SIMVLYRMLLLAVISISIGAALECVTGYTFFRGKTVGTETVKCSSDSESCYNISAGLTELNNVKFAGCTTVKCLFTKNMCVGQTILGRTVRLCCCNTYDQCNSKFTNMSWFEKTKTKIGDFVSAFG